MSPFIISCCSTADLTEEHLKKRGIACVCLHFSVDGTSYRDDFGKSLSYDEFYNRMRADAEVKTSQINVGEFIEYFTPFLEQGYDILHTSLSSGLSGTFNSATIAREQLKEQFPDRKIILLDSLCGSSGYGMVVNKLCDLRDQGLDIDECASWANQHIPEINAWFFVSDLKYLIKGGRISKAAGAIGTLLKICPIITADADGKLISKQKVRTKAKAIEELVAKMEQDAQGGKFYAEECFVCHAGCLEDAKQVAKFIENKFKNLIGKIKINSIGAAMGSHCGPGTVALFFWGAKRLPV